MRQVQLEVRNVATGDHVPRLFERAAHKNERLGWQAHDPMHHVGRDTRAILGEHGLQRHAVLAKHDKGQVRAHVSHGMNARAEAPLGTKEFGNLLLVVGCRSTDRGNVANLGPWLRFDMVYVPFAVTRSLLGRLGISGIRS